MNAYRCAVVLVVLGTVVLSHSTGSPWSGTGQPKVRAAFVGCDYDSRPLDIVLFVNGRRARGLTPDEARQLADTLGPGDRALHWQLYNAADQYDACLIAERYSSGNASVSDIAYDRSHGRKRNSTPATLGL